MTIPRSLSKEDISRLMQDHSTRSLMDVAEKITEHYTAEGKDALTPEQTAIANDIIKLLLSRAEVTVRAMLSMNLSQTDKLPNELALQMAKDVDEVAGSVLQYSHSLTDSDLTGLIHSMIDTDKLRAIARRDTVSENVSSMLAETHEDSVVNALVQNEGADIARKTFEDIAQHHGSNAQVVDSLLSRNAIPIEVVEKVVSHLSKPIRQTLEKKYGNLTEFKDMKKSLEQSMEMALIRMAGFKSSDKEMMELINQLDENNRLPPFSALSIGNLQLFEVSLSRLLRIPLKNVETLVADPAGFKVVYDRAKLPPHLFEAVALAVRAIRSLEQESLQKTKRKEIVTSTQVMERMRQLSAGKTIEGAKLLYSMMKHHHV